MNDPECFTFLQWCLPRLGMRWRGFRRVRRRVCKRVDRRLRDLGLADGAAYRRHLEEHPEEWGHLDGLCRVSISRFRRDAAVFDDLTACVLPQLAEAALDRGERELRCWCAGCASGEEAYTLRVLWDIVLTHEYHQLRFGIVGTDVDEQLIDRARRGIFPPSSLRELPAEWLSAAFEPAGGQYRVRDRFREDVRFLSRDMRVDLPGGPFHLVLCRNAAFTYFEERLQRELALGIATRMAPGAALVLGVHESLPEGMTDFSPWEGARAAFRRES